MKPYNMIDNKIERLGDDWYESHNKIAQNQLDILEWINGNMDCPIDGLDTTGQAIDDSTIDQAIDLLKKSKGKLPEYSFFGDANWKRIDAQIEILNWVKEA